MKIHTNIRQCNLGMIRSVPAWQLDYRLELTDEEAELIKTYRAGDRNLAKFTKDDGSDGYVSVSQAVDGVKGYVCKELGRAQAMRHSIVEGCGWLRDYLKAILEVRAGGGELIVDIPLNPQQSAQAGSPLVSQNSPPTIQAGATA